MTARAEQAVSQSPWPVVELFVQTGNRIGKQAGSGTDTEPVTSQFTMKISFLISQN